MLDEVLKRGPFATAPLCIWRYIHLGGAIPAGIALPDLPALGEEDKTPPPLIEREGDVATIHFHFVARFRIDFADRTITGFDIAPETADCVIDHILDDHIAPRLLAELGELVLHASTVQFGDRVALFLGETGAGKSTLATSLHQVGHKLLGDDAVIVTRGAEGYLAQPVYPSLRLYPEAIARLLGGAAATSPMADYSDKQHVHLPALAETAGAPIELAAMFFLSGSKDAPDPAAMRLENTWACIKLVEQSFSLDPRDRRCAARRLQALSQLALAVPAYQLSYPHDFARLDEVHAVIEAIIDNP
jgi:hypothetical protein